jgi:8-oxo-dGTP diphosphatase
MKKLSVTVDIVLFTIRDRRLQVLLIKRRAKPFANRYALPGGFVLETESVESAAVRELHEETGVDKVYLEQLYTFGDPHRDPRGRVITVAYYALVPENQTLHAGTDAAEAAWFPVSNLPALAFDHRKIVEYAHMRIRNKLNYTNVGFELLPAKFTLDRTPASLRSDPRRASRQTKLPPENPGARHRDTREGVGPNRPQARATSQVQR